MSVFRRPAQKDYFSSKRTWMQDMRLELKSTGLLARMLSMPSDWDFNQEDLRKRFNEGEDIIRSSLKQLVKFGYILKYARKRLEDGTLGEVFYDIFVEPQILHCLSDEQVEVIFSNSYSEKIFKDTYYQHFDVNIKEIVPRLDLPVLDEPALANPGLLSTKHSIKKNKETTTRDCVPPPTAPPTVVVSFGSLKVQKETADRIKARFTEEQIAYAVEVCEAIESRDSDSATLWLALKESWQKRPSKAEKQANDEQLLRSLDHLDSKDVQSTRICVGPSYVSFYSGPGYNKHFEINTPRFRENVMECLEKIGVKI